GVDGGHTQVPGGLIARDDAADRRRNDLADVPVALRAQLVGECPAQAFGLVGIHEDPRLLQEDRRTQAGAQDEVALEQGAAVAKDGEHVIGRHALAFSLASSQSATMTDSASATVARCTCEMPGVIFKVDSTSVSWARSLTSSSKMFL